MQTLLVPSDRKSGICNRMVPLRMLSIMTLSYIFKVTKFEMWLSRKRWALTKNAQVWFWYRLIFAIEWDQCEWCTPWLWPNFSRLNISNTNISEMWLWYLPLIGAIPKVVLCDVSLLFSRSDVSLLFQGQIFSEAVRAAQICQIRIL